MRRRKVLLIDGNNLVARMTHVFRDLISPEGIPCGGLYGAIKEIRKFLVMHSTDSVFVAFDDRVPKFRKRLVPEYKKKREEDRKKDPDKKKFYEEFTEQIRLIPEVLHCLGVSTVMARGYEADDVIGALTLKRFRSHRVTILSNDKDFVQLVGPRRRLWRPCDSGMTEERPLGFLLCRAIEGDSSDGISGVPKVGKVNAERITNMCATDDPDVLEESLNANDKHELAVLNHMDDVRDYLRVMDLRVTAKRCNSLLSFERGDLNRKEFKAVSKKYGFRMFVSDLRYYFLPYSRASLSPEDWEELTCP